MTKIRITIFLASTLFVIHPLHAIRIGDLGASCYRAILWSLGVEKVDITESIARVGPEISTDFTGTHTGLVVDPEVRAQIQNLKDEMLALSAEENYYGHPVCLTQNHCHGASWYLKRVLKTKLGLDATVVTYSPRDWNDGGFEHSFLIVRNFFGPNSPLIIDSTIKQFMPHEYHRNSHDIFVGSPEEYLHYMNDNHASRSLEKPVDSFEKLLRAKENPNFN